MLHRGPVLITQWIIFLTCISYFYISNLQQLLFQTHAVSKDFNSPTFIKFLNETNKLILLPFSPVVSYCKLLSRIYRKRQCSPTALLDSDEIGFTIPRSEDQTSLAVPVIDCSVDLVYIGCTLITSNCENTRGILWRILNVLMAKGMFVTFIEYRNDM